MLDKAVDQRDVTPNLPSLPGETRAQYLRRTVLVRLSDSRGKNIVSPMSSLANLESVLNGTPLASPKARRANGRLPISTNAPADDSVMATSLAGPSAALAAAAPASGDPTPSSTAPAPSAPSAVAPAASEAAPPAAAQPPAERAVSPPSADAPAILPTVHGGDARDEATETAAPAAAEPAANVPVREAQAEGAAAGSETPTALSVGGGNPAAKPTRSKARKRAKGSSGVSRPLPFSLTSPELPAPPNAPTPPSAPSARHFATLVDMPPPSSARSNASAMTAMTQAMDGLTLVRLCEFRQEGLLDDVEFVVLKGAIMADLFQLDEHRAAARFSSPPSDEFAGRRTEPRWPE